MQLLIGGTDRTGLLQRGTLSVDDSIGERSTCSFRLVDPAGALHFSPGQAVEVNHGGMKAFAGTIDKVTEVRPLGTSALGHDVQCVDWHGIPDRRIVAETYQNVLAGNVVRDLITKYLGVEGIAEGTPATIQDGPNVVEAVFNYVPATQCLDGLAERAGFAWWIDADRKLHFVARETYAAPWQVTDTSPIRGAQLSTDRERYRNRQFIRAGKDLTDPQVESFKGDGSTRTFTVGFPIGKVPTVKVNSITKTVGIKGIDTGKDWYWNKGDAVITQDDAAAPLGATDVLEVTYQGFFDIVVLADDYAAVVERQNVEGGTGYYEAAEDEAELSSLDATIQSANAKLRRHAKLKETLTFETDQGGLQPGQILTVTLAAHGLAGVEFLIEQVGVEDAGADAASPFRYRVAALSGESVGGWTRTFHDMATRGRAFVIRENIREEQVLVRLVQSSEGWQWGEAQTPTVFACPVPSSTLYPGASTYPC